MKNFSLLFTIVLFLFSCKQQKQYDVIIRHGMIYDGSGGKPFLADVAINSDTIVFIGDLKDAKAKAEIDATGKAVSPGFINMLSWSNESLIADGKSQSEIRQGVTLEVMGEGWSMGPWNDSMRKEWKKGEADIKYDVPWIKFSDYFNFLEEKGIACNVASFVGATTVRQYYLGGNDVAPTPKQLDSMKQLVRDAMEEGALGVGSSLIYPPAFYAKTEELIELCKAAAPYGGMYISHMRSEGNRLLQGTDELIRISKEADLPAEIYHMKQAGMDNWKKYDAFIAKIDSARKAGLKITADMYNYIAGATGLTASVPPWVQAGTFDEFITRLKDPAVKKKVMGEMITPSDDWENNGLLAGKPENILLVGFKQDSLKYLTGKTLAEVSNMRGTPWNETIIDLIIDDDSPIATIYFVMSEDNVKKEIQLPYMSFCSDEASTAPEGVFLKSKQHPRAYGSFARLLGKYVRDEKLIPLEEAINKLTFLSAQKLKIQKRGLLKTGYYADVVVFDPNTIADHATFDKPQEYATGVSDVFVNGKQVLKDGEHTGALPGRFVKGPGYSKKQE